MYEYNTSCKKLVLPEYGRNLQKMVDYCMQIQDRDERNRCANAIIAVMANINPHYRENSDFKHKLWDHLAIISDFKMDVDSPYEKPTADILISKPNRVPYTKNTIRFGHYGRILQLFVEEALKMDDGDRKNNYLQMVCNHMKRMYLMWNNDEIIKDEMIFRDLEVMSKNRLKVDRSIKLTEQRDIMPPRDNSNNLNKQRNQQRHKNYHGKNQQRNPYPQKQH